ncbi:HEPN domain protein [compost metagenome]
MSNEHRYAAAFHAQQSAEKAAKAFLVHHDLRPPRTHDLEELSLLIKDIDPKLALKLKKLKNLTRIAAIYRYPDAERKSVSVATIKTAIKGARAFYNVVAGHIIGKTALSKRLIP